MTKMLSGPYRMISYEEFIELQDRGEDVDWGEGCGYIVYDEQARKEFQNHPLIKEASEKWNK